MSKDAPRGAAALATAVLSAAVLVAALSIAPSVAAPILGDTGWFHADCTFSHRLPDDPIVFPGRPGASHSHDFAGGHVDAFSTNDSIRQGGTTCVRDDEVFKNQTPPEPSADKSGYWVPSLYVNDQLVTPTKMNPGYASGRNRNLAAIEAFPRDYKIIAGNATGGPQVVNGQAVWSYRCPNGTAGSGSLSPPSAPLCAAPPLVLEIRFPDCFDGRSDSADHKAHAAYSQDGACPASHPRLLPQQRLTTEYPTMGGPTTRLASGAVHTAHADFMNGWDRRELANLVKVCLRADEYCGATDGPAH
jgi:hypothetical protein